MSTEGDKLSMDLYPLAAFVSRAICFLSGFRTKGTENLDATKKGAILICNHVKWYDPFIVMGCFKRPVNFMAKRELFNNPILNFALKRVGSFPVDRHTADIKSIRTAIEIVQSGGVCVIFPEGTRSKSEELQEFEEGVAFITLRCGVEVFPSYITPPRWSRKNRKNRYFVVGKPANVAEVAENVPKEQKRTVVTKFLYDAVDALRKGTHK